MRYGVVESCNSYLPDVVVAATGVYLDTDTGSSPDVDESLGDLETQAGAVLDGTAPLVLALVGSMVEELLDEVAVGGVYCEVCQRWKTVSEARRTFNAVKAGLLGHLSGVSELLNDGARVIERGRLI